MAGKNAIQILRANSATIANSSETLLDGQLLYNTDKNYLTCGGGEGANKPVNSLPVVCQELAFYQGDANNISANTGDNNLIHRVGPNKLVNKLEIESKGSGINISVTPTSAPPAYLSLSSGKANLYAESGIELNALSGDVELFAGTGRNISIYGDGGVNIDGPSINISSGSINVIGTEINNTNGVIYTTKIDNGGYIDLSNAQPDILIKSQQGIELAPGSSSFTVNVNGTLNVNGSINAYRIESGNYWLDLSNNQPETTLYSVSGINLVYNYSGGNSYLSLFDSTASIRMYAAAGNIDISANNGNVDISAGNAKYVFSNNATGGNVAVMNNLHIIHLDGGNYSSGYVDLYFWFKSPRTTPYTDVNTFYNDCHTYYSNSGVGANYIDIPCTGYIGTTSNKLGALPIHFSAGGSASIGKYFSVSLFDFDANDYKSRQFYLSSANFTIKDYFTF